MASEAPSAHPEIGHQPSIEDAPPAYDDATGALDLRQDGLSTQYQVGDDGRVDIRINENDAQLATQIEQIHLTALQEESENPPTPAHTSSYRDGRPIDASPPLNVVIHVVGSRGDVQPFVALGRELKKTYGHRIRLATHGTFKKFVEENYLEFFDIGGNPAELMAFMVKNPGLIPGMKSLKEGDVGKRRKGMAEILQGCWRSCADADEAKEDKDDSPKAKPFIAHAIIANPPSFAHIHCAQKLGIPLHLMFTSPALIPKPKDWGRHISISGFYFLSLASNYQPEPDLAEFLASGPPPVYIGFGSIVVDDPNAMTNLIFEAVTKTGQRALVSKGWGGLGGSELSKPDGVFMLGNCPHDWLFQHVSCVVHHGGAGTTAAGIALGRPTVIVPFFGDQPFWGAMVARAGAGPSPITYKELTAEGLENAILEALKPETLERARELGDRIREEKGCEVGAANFHAQMDVVKLQCMMAPNRVAVWRLKTNGSKTDDVRLSAFAATVLGNEGLLDINQLTLYRPCEYAVEELNVISNMSGPNPILSSLGSFASGMIHWPINVGKAYAGVVSEPYKGAKADGWRGFGKGLGKGFGHVLFPRRGLIIGGTSYGLRAIYKAIKKRMGAGTLSFILAAHFSEGFEEVKSSTEEQRLEVLRRWHELAPDLKRKQSGVE
ncbi:hypothetical protein P7C71_g1235, partial [Lecanoromycetidae sp. Uapishka_2]